MSTRCFLMRPTGLVAVTMVRFAMYRDKDGGAEVERIRCQGPRGCHWAEVEVRRCTPEGDTAIPRSDPRWPSQCAHCGFKFSDADPRLVWTEKLYETGSGQVRLRDAPVGAMWTERDDRPGHRKESLWVSTPAGHWWIDKGNCERIGRPPDVTVRPGVRLTDGKAVWDGTITDGVLEGTC